MESPTELAAFRMPPSLRDRARQKAEEEDLTFSQLMRRAIRRELESSDQKQEPVPTH